jgi:hypothetical protein
MSRVVAFARAPLVLVGAAFALFASACEGTYDAAPLERVDAGTPICTVCGDCEEAFAVVERKHLVRPIAYPDYPPAGGPHDPCWAPWGVHETPVATARWVHNLEHGGIVYLYQPDDIDPGDLAELTRFVEEHGRTLVAPAPELTTTFAALAWGYRLLSSCFDIAATEQFRNERFARAPENIDGNPPANCR